MLPDTKTSFEWQEGIGDVIASTLPDDSNDKKMNQAAHKFAQAFYSEFGKDVPPLEMAAMFLAYLGVDVLHDTQNGTLSDAIELYKIEF